MSYRLQKIFSQMGFIVRRNYVCSQSARICERKLSLRIPQIEENENDDEFEENYIYDYPSYLVDDHTPHQTHLSISQIMQEMEIYSRFYFAPTPKCLTRANWIKLLELKDAPPLRRKMEFTNFAQRERTRELKLKRSELRRLEYKKDDDERTTRHYSTNDVVPYRMAQNSIFGLHLHRLMKMATNLLLVKKALFGPHIIIDCSYESHMTFKELKSCARQLSMLRPRNKRAPDPFNIIHCNVNPHGPLFQSLKSYLPDSLDPAFAFDYTEKNFVDLFPREKLIYLSPHADTELETYDHDMVYIIGAFVDQLPRDNLSTEKAQLNGIQSMKFPLDKYFNWCRGTKSLTLYQVLDILHDLKEGCSWEKTLSRNVQSSKTTFTGVYWQDRVSSTKASSVKHIEQLQKQMYIGRATHGSL